MARYKGGFAAWLVCLCVLCGCEWSDPGATNRRRCVLQLHSATGTTSHHPLKIQKPRGPATAPRVPQRSEGVPKRPEPGATTGGLTGLSHRGSRRATSHTRRAPRGDAARWRPRLPRHQSPARLAGLPARQRGAPMAARASSRQGEPAPPTSKSKPTRRGCESTWWGRRVARPRRKITRPSQREEVLNQHGRGGAPSWCLRGRAPWADGARTNGRLPPAVGSARDAA